MDDEKIIELYLQRNEKAIAETKLKYGRGLYTIALKILGNFEDAEECENDTYYKAWLSIPANRPSYLMAYLSRISRNAALERVDYRNAGKRHGTMVELCDELDYSAGYGSMDSYLDSYEIRRVIDTFLDELSDEKNAIFIRRYWAAESISQIAQALNISESKVKMTISRLKIKLRNFFEREGVHI